MEDESYEEDEREEEEEENEENEENIDNNMVEYEPDKMWFDYQALFEKTKNVVLERPISLNVKHTNFEKNKIAKHSLFNTDVNYQASLVGIINGEFDSFTTALCNCSKYVNKEIFAEESKSLSKKSIGIIKLNYRYILAISVCLGDFTSYLIGEYKSFTDDYLPDSVTTKSVHKICFKEVIDAYDI